MQKDFLTIAQLTKTELIELLTLAKTQGKGVTSTVLAGKQIAMLFEKQSLRTKASFEVGIRELGGQLSYFSQAECGKLGERESVADFGHVMERYYDGLVARVYSHERLADLAQKTHIPVINALSDLEHPCQALADLLTIWQSLGKLDNFKMVFLGDGTNVARSLAESSKILGFEFCLIGPKKYWFHLDGITCTEDLTGLQNADVVVTDTWISMGSEAEAATRLKELGAYQLNQETLAMANKDAIVLHCLPAHRGEEVTDSVLDGPQSKIFDEAANRLPVQKAVLIKLFS